MQEASEQAGNNDCTIVKASPAEVGGAFTEHTTNGFYAGLIEKMRR
jgi:hypothetical protein